MTDVLKQWTYKGLDCLIRGISLGTSNDINHYGGYVRVPSILFNTITFEDERIDIHGGVTFLGSFDGVPEVREKGQWIGFDTGHYGDMTQREYEKYPEKYPLPTSFQTIIWDQNMIVKETEHLAEEVLDLLPELEKKVNSALYEEERV